jgi:hypothetical protein
MKNLILFLLLTCTTALMAQETPTDRDSKKEFGVGMGSFNGYFELQYKYMLKEHKYLRLTGGSFSARASNDVLFSSLFGAVGFEKRTSIKTKTDFYWGLDGTLGLNFTTGTFNVNLTPGVRVPIGVAYQFNPDWRLSIEARPSAFFSFTNNSSANEFNLNANTNGFISINHCF